MKDSDVMVLDWATGSLEGGLVSVSPKKLAKLLLARVGLKMLVLSSFTISFNFCALSRMPSGRLDSSSELNSFIASNLLFGCKEFRSVVPSFFFRSGLRLFNV